MNSLPAQILNVMRHAWATCYHQPTVQVINMETINYFELKDCFEAQIKDDFQFKLLELHYAPTLSVQA